jgi:predicted kinase/FMN phosphatase YigB (HAD superfamily)
MLIAVGGGVASGKSTLARWIASRIGAIRIEADQTRRELVGERPDRQWTPDLEDAVYDVLLRRGESALAAGQSVVLDGCFPKRLQRQCARSLAEQHQQPFLFVECQCDPETIRARLAARDEPGREGSWLQIHDALASHWEPTDDLDPGSRQVLDCSRPLAETTTALASRLRRMSTAAATTAAPRRLAAVTFDCWATLVVERDWPTAHALRVEALRESAQKSGVTISVEKAGEAFDRAWGRHMSLWRDGVATGARDVARWALEDLEVSVEPAQAQELVERLEEASHSGHVEALPGALTTLQRLRELEISTALVCDTGLTPGRVVRGHLERLGLMSGLDSLAFSDEVGVPKPDRRIFRAALDPLGVASEDALHVGDLRAHDVAGARSIGMRTVRIRAHHDDRTVLPDADRVVDDHATLAAWLAELAGTRSAV